MNSTRDGALDPSAPSFNTRIRRTLVAAVRIRCFVEDTVVAAASVGGDIVAAAAVGIAVAAASVAVEAGCTAVAVGIAAAAVGPWLPAGCTDLVGAWGAPSCFGWTNRCGAHHRFVLRIVAAPRGPVGCLRGRVSAGTGWATKS